MKRVFALERFVTGVLGLALLLGYFACLFSYCVGRRCAAPAGAIYGSVAPRSARHHRRRGGLRADQKMTMTVVILDEEGQLISADRMEGACSPRTLLKESLRVTHIARSHGNSGGASQDPARPLLRHHEHVSRRSLSGRWRSAAVRE